MKAFCAHARAEKQLLFDRCLEFICQTFLSFFSSSPPLPVNHHPAVLTATQCADRIFLASLARSLAPRRIASVVNEYSLPLLQLKRERKEECVPAQGQKLFRQRPGTSAFQINVVDYFARMTAFAFNLQNFSLLFRAQTKPCPRGWAQKTRSRACDLFSAIARISE